jgi:hypothetical protein
MPNREELKRGLAEHTSRLHGLLRSQHDASMNRLRARQRRQAEIEAKGVRTTNRLSVGLQAQIDGKETTFRPGLKEALRNLVREFREATGYR